MAHAFREKPLKGGCFWRFSHEHLPYISEKPPYEPQNLPYVSEIGGIIKHFPALMSRRMNQTTKFAMLCMPSSPRTSLSTYVATIWSAIALFQCSDGRCMLVVKPSLCGLNCQPAAESVHDLHNGLEARVAVPVEALVKLSRPRPSPSRSAPYPLLWTHRRLRPATTPDRQARPPHRGTRWPSSSVSRCSLGSHLLTVRSISFTITPP